MTRIRTHKNSNILIKNSWWDMFQQAYILIVSFLVGLAVARYLGPDNYGIIGEVSSVISFFVSVSWLGIDSIIVNELILNREQNAEYIGTSIAVKFLMSIASLMVSYGFVVFFYGDVLTEKVLVIYGISMIFQFYEIFKYFFQSRQEFKTLSVSIIIAKTLVAIYQIFLIQQKRNILWFASAGLVYDILVCFLLSIIYYKRIGIMPKADIKTFKRLWDKSCHFIVSSVAITLYMQVDRIMIGKILSNTEVGIYSAAVYISGLWQFVPLAIINAARPIIVEKKKESEEAFWGTYKRLLCVVTMLSVGICILVSIFAKYILYLTYGVDYMDATIPLRVCTWATAIAMIGVVRGIWMISFDYNKFDKYFTTIAALVNICLNVFAIKHWGIIGASITTIVSYFIEVFVVNYLFRETRDFNKIYIESLAEWNWVIKSAGKYIKSFLERDL